MHKMYLAWQSHLQQIVLSLSTAQQLECSIGMYMQRHAAVCDLWNVAQAGKQVVEAEEGKAASLRAQCDAGSKALAHERLALEQDRSRLQVNCY